MKTEWMERKGRFVVSMAKIACAIWPWGVENKEQMIQALKDVGETGYTAFESVKAAIDVFKGNAREFRSIVDEYGVKPVSFYFHMSGNSREDIGELQRKIGFLAELGVHRMSLQAPGIKGRKPTEDELKEVLETVTEFGKIARRYEVLPCVHPHNNTMVMYEDEIDFILQNTDPELIAFGPDTAHLTVGLCDAADVMRKYAGRIRFLHLKDYNRGEAVDSKGVGHEGVEVYANFRELGEGCVDFSRVFRVLKDAHYDGYMCTELDISRFGNKISAEMNYWYIMKNYYAQE